MLAGGFTDDADMKKVQVIRLVHGEASERVRELAGPMHGAPTPARPVTRGYHLRAGKGVLSPLFQHHGTTRVPGKE